MERKEGWYWVNHYSNWKFAYYSNGGWKFAGIDATYNDGDFTQINETSLYTKTYQS